MGEELGEIGVGGTGVLRLRLRGRSDLASARRRTREHLAAARVPADAIDDVVLALSELATNAVEAADEADAIEVVITTPSLPTPAVVCHVDNLGVPFPGHLVVSPLASVDPVAARGRGLAIAARLGRVEIEGLIGGTRAVFRRPC